MPYKIVKRNGKFCVVTHKSSGEHTHGCHPTKEEAQRQISAIGMHSHRALHTFQSSLGRHETFDGRDHLVVPIIALVEGVVRASNSEGPELAPAAVFNRVVQAWDGRPIFLGHPMVDGKPVRGNTPDILPSSIGKVLNAKAKGRKLTMEAWIDVEKANQTEEGRNLLARAEAGEPVEVSTGLLVRTENEEGEYDGEPYESVWRETFPDHLAMLSEREIGACSFAMGCGLRAASRYRITEEGMELMAEEKDKRTFLDWLKDLVSGDAKLESFESELEGLNEFKDLKGAEFSSKNKSKIQSIHDQTVALGAQCAAPAEPKAMSKPCGCHKESSDMKTKEARVKALIAAEGSPFSKQDESTLLKATDEQLDRFEKKVLKGGKSSGALIKAVIDKIIANPDLPFTEEDRDWLSEAPEERLVEFAGWAAGDDKQDESSSGGDGSQTPDPSKGGKGGDASGTAVDKQTNPDGTPKTMTKKEEKVEQKPKTTEEFLKDAPQEIKDLVSRQRKADETRKIQLVGQLKDAQTEFTEEELKTKSVDELERFCRAFGADFSGRGLPASETTDRKPVDAPNGYKIAIDARNKR